jgi:two-component system, chemotaxis family, response regulator Rcp1
MASSCAAVRPLELLLVEDNPGDVRLTREALKSGKVATNLSVARDGVEAMEFLQRRGSFESAPRPDLILLDLNLPRKSGREVLLEVKSDPELKRIPVLVMTTSRADQDISRVYSLNANCYITKPMELDEFLRIVRSIEDFWLKTVALPGTRRSNGRDLRSES